MIFENGGGQIEFKIDNQNKTIWATQSQIAMLFDTTKQNVSLHLKTIFEGGELFQSTTVKKFLTTATDGVYYNTKFYNLDAKDFFCRYFKCKLQ